MTIGPNDLPYLTPKYHRELLDCIVTSYRQVVAAEVCLPGLDLQQHLLQKEANLKTMGLTVQPHIIVISDDINSVDAVNGSITYAVIHSTICIMNCLQLQQLLMSVLRQALSWIYLINVKKLQFNQVLTAPCLD